MLFMNVLNAKYYMGFGLLCLILVSSACGSRVANSGVTIDAGNDAGTDGGLLADGGTDGGPDGGGCVPETDAQFCLRLGKNCDIVSGSDNCGTSRTVNCGTCSVSGECCSGGGVANVCGKESTTQFCTRQGKDCGEVTAPDNCGTRQTYDCGTCLFPGECCGGGGTANACGKESIDQFCVRYGKNCDNMTAPDTCGETQTYNCGACSIPAGECCGGGGWANVCGKETSTQFCDRLGFDCGEVTAPNNCGATETYNCGTCLIPGECCAGGGAANVCGKESSFQFCTRLGKDCDNVTADDTCGTSQTYDCGTCSVSGECCAGGGSANVCGKESSFQFCTRLGKDCDNVTADDTCGTSQTYDCGTCSVSGECCAGGGTANVCGKESSFQFCTRLGKDCDNVTAADTCGTSQTYNCGTCSSDKYCYTQQCLLRCSGKCLEMISIPDGGFGMGCTPDQMDAGMCDPDPNATPTPFHTVVFASGFAIDKYEVTSGDYKKCVDADAGVCTPTIYDGGIEDGCTFGKSGKSDFPINCVSWTQGKNYCQWVGKDLPSEAQWERAARYTDGRMFPWGDAPDPDCTLAVMNDSSSGGSGCGTDAVMAVGSRPDGGSQEGLLDMTGNVWEWLKDDHHGSYNGAPVSGGSWGDGTGTGNIGYRRGGSYTIGKAGGPPDYVNLLATTRVADLYKNGLETQRSTTLGFRCASPLPSEVSVISIEPNSGVNNTTVSFDIRGSVFGTGATAKLTKSGQTDITPITPCTFIDSNHITCTFNLTAAIGGKWNVVVTNNESRTGMLSEGFTVIPGGYWSQATAAAQFTARKWFTSVAFDGGMWVIGGTENGDQNDVWYSSNGADWAEATADAGFLPRDTHSSVVFDGKMWVIGGFSGSISPNFKDVWYSSNGIDWTEATANAGFSERWGHSSVAFDGGMWVIGGYASNDSNDVWYSPNGADWTEATASAGFSPRDSHTSVVYDGKMWVIGGEDNIVGELNDVWYSSNGTDWTEATSDAGFSGRDSHTSVVFDGKMWVIAGGSWSARIYYNDVWYSTNGTDWTQAAADAQFPARNSQCSVVFDDRMWVIGGEENYYSLLNDVWYAR